MKFERAEDFARRLALPHVSAALHTLHVSHTCGLMWAADDERNGVIVAQPLARDAPWLPYARVEVVGEAGLNEHVWYLDNITGSKQGLPGGRVNLTVTIAAMLKVPHGMPVNLSHDQQINGFLCWADRYELHDKSICYRIETNGGFVWLRPRGDADLAQLLYCREPTYLGRHVVQITETMQLPPSVQSYADHPWAGYKTKDTTGRTWHIAESLLGFSAHLELSQVGRFNHQLREKKTIDVLPPPYDAIWLPYCQPETGLPLTLAVTP